jgi:hypothetical protein
MTDNVASMTTSRFEPTPIIGLILLVVALASPAQADSGAVVHRSNTTPIGDHDGEIMIWADDATLRRAGAVLGSPNPSSVSNQLRSVTAPSAHDAWAVGLSLGDPDGSTSSTLIVRWDGTSWSQTPSPNPSSTRNELYSVSARTATDAWAVGWFVDDLTGVTKTLILHWDGVSWSEVSSPNPGDQGNTLIGVSVQSATDVWAVGTAYNTGTHADSLILHWDGTSWSRIRAPDVMTLRRVSAGSVTDAWAVGVKGAQPLHWDGTRWTQVPTHGPRTTWVWGLDAVTATDAWSVGSYLNSANHVDTLIQHWDGTRWSQIDTPTVGRGLMGVTILRPRDGWAVGHRGLRRMTTLIYRWDGRRWSTVPTPNPSSSFNELWDVSALSARDAWAVGTYRDEVTEAERVLILHWDGTSWTQV